MLVEKEISRMMHPEMCVNFTLMLNDRSKVYAVEHIYI